MRVAVTGCAGFIGSHVAYAASASGWEVVCIDNMSRSGWYPRLLLRYAGLRVAEVDVRDSSALTRLLEGVDVVVHAAALVSVWESMERPSLYASNNVAGTAAVLEAVRDAGVEALVYTSSAAVYGEPAQLPVGEEHPVRPISPYGLFKACEEELIRIMSSHYGYRYAVLRLFNVYGPGQNPGYAGVVEKFAEAFTRGGVVTIYGDGGQTRDFVHVYDVARAVLLAARALLDGLVDGCTVNIASGRGVSVRTLYGVFSELTGRSPPVVYAAPRPGDIYRSVASLERARRLLGYTPRIGLREGLRTVILYHENPVLLLTRYPPRSSPCRLGPSSVL